MNRINPMYPLLLALSVVIVSFILNFLVKDEFIQINQSYFERLRIAKEYQILKSNHQSKAQIKERLEGILNDKKFKKENIKVEKIKGKWKIVLKSENLKILHDFLNRILKDRFSIEKMEVSDKTIKMEVRM